MKQNERLLVYAVTGFLAVILVIAVVFGPSGRDGGGSPSVVSPPGAAPVTGSGAKGLGELLGAKDDTKGGAAADTNPAEVGIEALPAPSEVAKQQPLVAIDPATLAADLLQQQLGQSRRDRTVRMVRARSGDSLEMLVRRWCGARDPFLDEAKALNEELTVLRVGQEVCVPWVDDAVVLAAVEANQPKTLLAGGGSVPGTSSPAIGSLRSVLGGKPVSADAGADTSADARPDFAMPGTAGDTKAADAAVSKRTAAEYVVKTGDSLWKIADRTYGRQLAARMVGEIKLANPGLDEQKLRVGAKLVLPKAP